MGAPENDDLPFLKNVLFHDCISPLDKLMGDKKRLSQKQASFPTAPGWAVGNLVRAGHLHHPAQDSQALNGSARE
jgi:hypothetical protein